MTIRRLLVAMPFVFVGWIGVMATVMFVSDAAPAAVVIFPSPQFLEILPDDVAIMSATNYSVTLKNASADFGRTLYAAGAMLVLPAGLTGCLPLPRS